MEAEDTINHIRKAGENLGTVFSHPAFMNLIQEMQKLPPNERENYAKVHFTPQKLKELGVPLPDAFRITTRYFEDPLSEAIQGRKIGEGGFSVDNDLDINTTNKMTVCGSVGFVVCVSVGC